MKEDSNVLLKWLYEVKEFIEYLGDWSLFKFFIKMDYYRILLEKFRKFLFYILFDLGFLGFLGVIIKDEMLCVVLMLLGGIFSCFYEGFF